MYTNPQEGSRPGYAWFQIHSVRQGGPNPRAMIGRVLRRLALRLVRLGIRRRRLIFLGFAALTTLIVAGVFGAGSRIGLSFPATPSIGQRADGEPEYTARYLKGQELYDAKMVWDSYSDRVLSEAQLRGLSLDDTQKQLDRARQAGNKIEQVSYIGGYPIPNGSMQFYLVFRSDLGRREAVPVPYVFTLDAAGKIDSVE